MRGLRLALSWLTVLPVPAPEVDGRSGARAISWAPVVGLLLGGLASGLLLGLGLLGAPPLLAGLLVVAALALLTRGMHLDGLADTADGLGCYGPPERALAVMKDGGAGPFAVVTLILVLGVQATGMSADRWGALLLAVTTGRIAFTWCCRRGVPAARPTGLGALVADTQPLAIPVSWTLAALGGAWFAVPGHPWLGPVAVLLATGVPVLLVHHARRRFGGVTGDVLGAACELGTTVVLVVCSLG
ncbi:adenosylcobinamide-GDP ribazoletransferase [Kutzneria viridogrisea]|uniref:Adenosylcobinamide-GDP ribazoletransferase n=1 Tax=Kutzneria viridogrisea TaxID=47990 RepID=A0ABR6BKZ3_9PSEU|nr:adenosylcobinamide-GDP ribazoletransferase [Kutzneria viridogrisea]